MTSLTKPFTTLFQASMVTGIAIVTLFAAAPAPAQTDDLAVDDVVASVSDDLFVDIDSAKLKNGTLQLTLLVENDGDVASPASPLEIRSSTDDVLDDADPLLASVTLKSVKAAKGSKEPKPKKQKFKVPAGDDISDLNLFLVLDGVEIAGPIPVSLILQ